MLTHKLSMDRAAGEAATALEVRALGVAFGGILALDSVSFTVAPGEICALIGPNGAGKTTLFNCLCRLYRPSAGSIHYRGCDLLALRRDEIAGSGIGRTFQNLALFPSLSVAENIAIGAHSVTQAGFAATALGLPSVRREESQVAAEVGDILDFLQLGGVAERPVSALPFGTQKRVELGRALASKPTLLLLDEPAAGLNHEEVDALGSLVRDIRMRYGTAVLLIEHHMNMVMALADHVVVLEFGRKIADGRPAEVQQDPRVLAAYLGADE